MNEWIQEWILLNQRTHWEEGNLVLFGVNDTSVVCFFRPKVRHYASPVFHLLHTWSWRFDGHSIIFHNGNDGNANIHLFYLVSMILPLYVSFDQKFDIMLLQSSVCFIHGLEGLMDIQSCSTMEMMGMQIYRK